MIAAGGDAYGTWTLMIKDDGQLWSLGSSNHGHGKEHVALPAIVEAMRGKQVVQVSAGGYHNLVLTESGEVFSWGYGAFGRLGHGDTEDQTLPKLIVPVLAKRVVVEMCAGISCSLVRLASGEVLRCGVFPGLAPAPNKKDLPPAGSASFTPTFE